MQGMKKRNTFLLAILFLSLSAKVYPQYLEPADINRFRENLSRFPNFFHVDIFHADWNYYHFFRETVEACGEAYEEIMYYMEEANAKEYAYLSRKQINDLLNYYVPEVIYSKYHSMGLFNNGHQKITTMIFGALYIDAQETSDYIRLVLERGFDEEEGDLNRADLEEIERMREMGEIYLDTHYGLFGERDLYILRNNMEFVEEILDLIPDLWGNEYDRRDRDGG
jgi:hypothetical protein